MNCNGTMYIFHIDDSDCAIHIQHIKLIFFVLFYSEDILTVKAREGIIWKITVATLGFEPKSFRTA